MTIDAEDAQRFEKDVPDDLESQSEIEDYIRDNYNTFTPHARRTMAEKVADIRPHQKQVRERSSIGGTSDNRFVEIHDALGRFFGKEENVIFWTDRWGNLMGKNERTGKIKKIADSEDR